MKIKDNYFYGKWGRDLTLNKILKQLRITLDPSRKYLLAEDGARFMGKRVKEAILGELNSWGLNVCETKQETLTPFAVREAVKNDFCSIIITAGSSPQAMMGFKVFDEKGNPHPEVGLNGFDNEKKVKIKNIPTTQLNELLSIRKRQKPKKITIQTSNPVVEKIAKKIFDTHTVFTLQVDKNKPYKHRVDDVARHVVGENCDLGFVLDDSGERFFIIDDKGFVWPGEWIQAFLYKAELEKRNGAIVCAVNTSNIFQKIAKELNQKIVFTTTREKDLHNALKKTNGLMAVKRGNITIPFLHNTVPDALYCIISLMNHLQKTSEPLSKTRISISDKYGKGIKRTLILQLEKSEHVRLKNFFREEPVMNLAGSPLVSVRDLQGIRTDYENGSWFWANTEEHSRIEVTMEAEKKSTLQQMEHDLLEQIKK
ncbi:hypothetical protein CL659_00440 [bacterium]|nr:hypothetical protein [bacterium]|tara:strand:- start:22675 stop:23952 length:1278 start_codon:yes stop_codon:yes gene_type:complete